MYKLIIADDESVAIKKLEKYVSDLCPDFQVVATFRNGRDLIEYIKDNPVDVVITDVRMPKADGLEVARFIYDNIPQIKVVMMSAYLEFEYAKQAMDYGAVAYLTKVVKTSDFISTMDKVRKMLKSESSTTDYENKSKYEIFLENLFLGAFSSEEEMRADWEKINSRFSFDNAVCEVVKFKTTDFEKFITDKWRDTEEVLKSLLTNFIRMTYDELCAVSLGIKDNEFGFAILHTKQHSQNLMDNLLNKFRDILGFNIQLTFQKIVKLSDFWENKEELYSEMDSENIDNSLIEDEYANKIVIQNAKKYISEFYGTNLTREDIANYVHLSYKQLDRIFKGVTSKTVYEYLTEVRMKEAARRIKNGDSVEAIYLDVGYQDKRNFRRAFMKFYNCSVSDYKKQLNGAINEE